MIWTVKSKATRRKEYLMRVSKWHKKFLWLPQPMSLTDGVCRWAWLQSVFRRANLTSDNYRDPERNFRWEYCSDEFDMLQKASIPPTPHPPRFLGLNGWGDRPEK